VGIVTFPTRFGLYSHTAIVSVFIGTSAIGKYDLYPPINGLSDHDAQLLILNKGQKKECHTYIKRKINKYEYTIAPYGYDEISTKILKISCLFISSPLNYICNKILFWGVFPDRLKYAVIKPLHKNGDRCEMS
jgi:hypothetical protein